MTNVICGIVLAPGWMHELIKCQSVLAHQICFLFFHLNLLCISWLSQHSLCTHCGSGHSCSRLSGSRDESWPQFPSWLLHIRGNRDVNKQLQMNVSIAFIEASTRVIVQEHSAQERVSCSACNEKTCHKAVEADSLWTPRLRGSTLCDVSAVNLGKVNTISWEKEIVPKMCVEYDANFVTYIFVRWLMYVKICIVFDNSFSLSEYICFTALCLFWTSLIPSSVSGTQMCPFTDHPCLTYSAASALES